MSLMTVRSASPLCSDSDGAVALLGGERGIEQELRHADDAVHRRPDLVAHIGEEFGLHPAGGFGGFDGAGPFVDALLELTPDRLEVGHRGAQPGGFARRPIGEALVDDRAG